MNSLATAARQRGLPILAELLAARALEPDRDPALDEPVTSDPVDAIDQIRRRGFDPRLVRLVLGWLADRPLELGLFSWDVLGRSIGLDEELLGTLRSHAALVRDILPAPGSTFADFSRVDSVAAVERRARAPYSTRPDDELMKEAVTLRALGAIDELRRRHGVAVFHESGVAVSTLVFAVTLNICQMPTLASFYLDYDRRALEVRGAIGEHIEVLLETGAVGALPPRDEILKEGSSAEVELAAYVDARVAILAGRPQEAFDALVAIARTDFSDIRSADELLTTPRVHVALAEAGILVGKHPVPLPLLDEIVTRSASWRYAQRVRAVFVAATADASSLIPPLFAEKFLETFGNDVRMWELMRRCAPPGAVWTDALLARLAGEALALPHDLMAWRALAAIVDTEERGALAELTRCIERQCGGTP